MISSKYKNLQQDSRIPDTDILEAFSVKIECKDENDSYNNGTGTIFSDGVYYYIITAAHSIQYDKTANHFDPKDIKAFLPHKQDVNINVLDVLMFDLSDGVDFALLKANLQSNVRLRYDYYNDFGIVGEDNFGQNLCVYGYTEAYKDGNLFLVHRVSSDRYSIDEGITASGKDFGHTMKGSSGGGVHVVYDNRMYCVGVVKGRDTETDKLDQVYVRRIPNINDKLCAPVWKPSILDDDLNTASTHSASSTSDEIDYNKYWDEINRRLANNENITNVLDDISNLRKRHPYIKSISRQERLINSLLRNKEKWTDCENRAFIYAIQDRGLWPKLFGTINQYDGNMADVPELRAMTLRASTYALGTEDGDLKLDETSDSDIYEMILRDAFSFEFDSMYEKVCNWNPSGAWVAKKVLLLNSFRKDEDSLKTLADYIGDKNNPASERFVASLIYNVSSQEFPLPMKYEEFWHAGIDSPSEIIEYIANRIDNKKVAPTIFGVHTTTLFGNYDSTSFPESIRLLQYIVNSGITTKCGIYNIINVEHWMKVFRHLVYFIPFPIVYYTLQYADEKTVRWAGQMISYRNDEFVNSVRPILLVSLLKAMRKEHIPRYVYTGLCYMTQELYMAVPEDEWYEEFKESVLDKFINTIHIENVSSSDMVFENLRAAFQCIRTLGRREEVFIALISVMKRNPILISRLICEGIWVDQDLATLEKVKKCLWEIIDSTQISKSYNVFCTFGCAKALSEDMLSAIDKKIIEEDLNFAQSDYPAIINLSNLVASADGVDKIKQLVKDGDIWNCGITDAYRTDPMPFHIEMLSEKVKWTEKDWKQIWPNMDKNLTLIEHNKEVGKTSNFYNCMYINLLTDMKLFLVRLKKESGIHTDEISARIEADIRLQAGFGNLMEALSTDDYNKIVVALDLLNVCLKTKPFEEHLPEIQLIIMKIVLMQSSNIDKCISFVAHLMYDYRKEMTTHFSSILLLMLKTYYDYDFEKFNFNVPKVNHWFCFIASQMKPEFDSDSVVKYWTSEAIVKRFGNTDYSAIKISNE